jgi:hypothetical protein
MQLEKDREIFYGAAGGAASPGLSKILTMLATAERIHYAAFERMKRNRCGCRHAILMDAEYLCEDAGGRRLKRTAFLTRSLSKAQGMKRRQKPSILSRRTEQGSHRADLPPDCRRGEKAFLYLQNIIDFVSRPESWLENAEWHHLDEY